MNKNGNQMTARFRHTLILLFFYSSLAFAGREITESKRVKLDYPVPLSKDIRIEGYETVLEIESWDKQEIEIIAEVNYSGKESKSVRKFLDSFEEHVRAGISDAGSNFKIDTRLDDPKKISVGFGQVQFLSIDYGNKELNITYFLKVPSKNEIAVENKYSDIIMKGEYRGEVEIEQYSGDLDAGTFTSGLELELKYGQGKINRISNSNIELYEQKLKIGKATDVDLNAKYSTVEIDNAETLTVDGYETRIEVKEGGKIEGEMKYGSLSGENELSEVILDLYETDLEFNTVNSLTLEESKYCEIDIVKAAKLDFRKSYEDDLEIEVLSHLKAESKYSDFIIDRLEGSFELDSYEGEIEINEVGPDFKDFDLKGKYNKLNIDLGSEVNVNLIANLKYGKFDYPEDRYERKLYIKDNDNIKAELESKRGAENAVTLNIEGYDSKVNIR